MNQLKRRIDVLERREEQRWLREKRERMEEWREKQREMIRREEREKMRRELGRSGWQSNS